MYKHKRSTEFGAALLIFAILLRLADGGFGWMKSDRMGQILAFLETGRVISLKKLPSAPTSSEAPAPTAPETQPPETQPPAPTLPRFEAADLALTPLRYSCDYRPDTEKLLLSPLRWELCADAPTVLIVHTHATESYTRESGQTYSETTAYRTLDESYNMLAVGDALARLLEEAGIGVIHDRQLHDYPSYNSSYANSRKSVKAYLEEYPGILLVLDLHRDAVEKADGSQLATHAVVNGCSAAQIMFLVGTDASGNHHPNWQENLALAAKLNVCMEQLCPGITRATTLRAQRFNQDLGQLALLVEIGSAGNTLEEALRAVSVLAQAILLLQHGADGA